LAPENTKASFEAALKSKADYIEFDVRSTSDGKLVISHDPSTDASYSDLKSENPELLTFDEACKLLGNKKPYWIDIKDGNEIGYVISSISKSDLHKNTLIASFNYSTLREFKKEFPKYQLVVMHPWSSIIATSRAKRLNTKFIAMNHRWLWRGVIKSLIRRGFKIVPYTMNNQEKIASWKKLGIYGVITDNPNIMND